VGTETRILARDGDISPEFDSAMRLEGVSAWDIETDGLDFQNHPIRTCQVYVPGAGVEIVKIREGAAPPRLADALNSSRVFKVFHHAPFDLRFMRLQWGVRPHNVACTKVLSKIVMPERDSHSLAPLVREYLHVELDKSERLSDWAASELSPEQLKYAVNDVIHLLDLYQYLWKEALNSGVGDLVERSFAYLPVRVETDLRMAGDVFSY
jgi:ribonuclease D